MHKEKKNSITSRRIAQKIGFHKDATFSTTRGLVFQCAIQYKLPWPLIQEDAISLKTKNNLAITWFILTKKLQVLKNKKIVTDNYKEEK